MAQSPIPISEWLDMMPDVVSFNSWVSQDMSGVPTYSSVTQTYPCHIELKNHLVIDHMGREVMARGRVIIDTVVIPTVKDKVTLPVEYTPVNPPILAVNVVPDDFGNHHVTIEIG